MEEKVTPFAMQFQEAIPKEDVAQVTGKYNEASQTWEWPRNSNNPALVASFPKTERPPTTCIRPTQINPKTVRADTVADD